MQFYSRDSLPTAQTHARRSRSPSRARFSHNGRESTSERSIPIPLPRHSVYPRYSLLFVRARRPIQFSADPRREEMTSARARARGREPTLAPLCKAKFSRESIRSERMWRARDINRARARGLAATYLRRKLRLFLRINIE